MNRPLYELPEGMTYEQMVAEFAEAIRKGREEATEPRPLAPGEVAFRDQMDAAHEEQIERIHAVAAMQGHSVSAGHLSDDQLARLTLAWLACDACPHIKKNPALRHVALLAIHRLACQRCAGTVINPPPENEDRCDWCWSHGHSDFWPIRMSYRSAVLIGDACDACNAKLKAETPASDQDEV